MRVFVRSCSKIFASLRASSFRDGLIRNADFVMVRDFNVLYSVLLNFKLERRWPYTVNTVNFFYFAEVAYSLRSKYMMPSQN